MLYVVHGKNELDRDSFATRLAAQHGVPLLRLSADRNPSLDELLSQDLFSGAQVIVLENKAEEVLVEEAVDRLAASANYVVFVETNLDLRTKFAKSLVANTRVEVHHFELPIPADLPSWVMSSAGQLGANMSAAAARTLCQRLGYVDPIGGLELALRTPSLSRLTQEVKKLAVYAAREPIDENMVLELVPDEQNFVSLAIADAVAKRDRSNLIRLLFGYYESGGDDEQGKTLALLGLLAEQFRSQLLVKDALEKGAKDVDILARTGWKPGRLFVVKRLAGSFTAAQLRNALLKLEALDIELKSTSTPPRVVLELILAQMV